MTVVSISTVTDPIDGSNQTNCSATGTTNVSTNTVSISVVDNTNTTVGPFSATVAGTGWSVSGMDLSPLADGTVIYMATATALDTTQAFDAASASKGTAVPNYITEAEFRAFLGDPSATADSAAILTHIASASRWVEDICGRHFYQTTETQYFTPEDGFLWRLDLDDMDLATTAGMTVHVEFGIDGTYPTQYVLNTDFICEPINRSEGGIDGWPYTWLRTVNGKVWPQRYAGFYRDTVKVTGLWGWAAVPEPVKTATKLKTAELYGLRGAPFGASGYENIGVIRVRGSNPVVTGPEGLLVPYQKTTSKFLLA